MLNSLVEYNIVNDKLKTAIITSNNISLSPTKHKNHKRRCTLLKTDYVHAE